jgi:hypothetical protein
VFKLEAEDGTWLSGIRLGPPNWKPGDEETRGCSRARTLAQPRKPPHPLAPISGQVEGHLGAESMRIAPPSYGVAASFRLGRRP